MKEQKLTDPDVELTDALLESETGDLYPVLAEFLGVVRSDAFGFNPEWRYYKDGKAWLCKITFKKKTVAWLSVWEKCFKVGFYFTEKTGAGIERLNISNSLKDEYRTHKPIGRLKPLIADIMTQEQLADVTVLMRYKVGKK